MVVPYLCRYLVRSSWHCLFPAWNGEGKKENASANLHQPDTARLLLMFCIYRDALSEHREFDVRKWLYKHAAFCMHTPQASVETTSGICFVPLCAEILLRQWVSERRGGTRLVIAASVLCSNTNTVEVKDWRQARRKPCGWLNPGSLRSEAPGVSISFLSAIVLGSKRKHTDKHRARESSRPPRFCAAVIERGGYACGHCASPLLARA